MKSTNIQENYPGHSKPAAAIQAAAVLGCAAAADHNLAPGS